MTLQFSCCGYFHCSTYSMMWYVCVRVCVRCWWWILVFRLHLSGIGAAFKWSSFIHLIWARMHVCVRAKSKLCSFYIVTNCTYAVASRSHAHWWFLAEKKWKIFVERKLNWIDSFDRDRVVFQWLSSSPLSSSYYYCCCCCFGVVWLLLHLCEWALLLVDGLV